ncbi:MAG: metallopeptidase TldD-related protein, partial [Pseudomonadota bacterium]
IGSLVSALSGGAVARGTSMLKDKMDQQICGDHITIVDDPFLKQGLRSKPFDGEGMTPQKRNLIDQGRLTGWLLDLRSARQLGLTSTGNASRSASGTPSPRAHNLYMLPGELPPEDLIADIKEGLYVTEMMGSSVSLLTGDYSRGVAGFWIENGKIAYPVSEITIAGNLADMWLQMTPANDLKFDHGINAPTLRIEKMMVAGD